MLALCLVNILTLDTCFMESVLGNVLWIVLWRNYGSSENIGLMSTSTRMSDVQTVGLTPASTKMT